MLAVSNPKMESYNTKTLYNPKTSLKKSFISAKKEMNKLN